MGLYRCSSNGSSGRSDTYRIVTTSTGGNDAAVAIYKNDSLLRNVLYGEVLSSSTYTMVDKIGIRYYQSWYISAPDNAMVYLSESPTTSWGYSRKVDFTLWVARE